MYRIRSLARGESRDLTQCRARMSTKGARGKERKNEREREQLAWPFARQINFGLGISCASTFLRSDVRNTRRMESFTGLAGHMNI